MIGCVRCLAESRIMVTSVDSVFALLGQRGSMIMKSQNWGPFLGCGEAMVMN